MMHTCACGVHEQYTSGCFVVLQGVYLVALCSQCELKWCSTVKSAVTRFCAELCCALCTLQQLNLSLHAFAWGPSRMGAASSSKSAEREIELLQQQLSMKDALVASKNEVIASLTCNTKSGARALNVIGHQADPSVADAPPSSSGSSGNSSFTCEDDHLRKRARRQPEVFTLPLGER
eukprot:3269-Heterococcus_DN1.PRE.6